MGHNCEICGLPMSSGDLQNFRDEGAPDGEWPCCHADCAELELRGLAPTRNEET